MSHDQEDVPVATSDTSTVVASVVPDPQRMDFLPTKFGPTLMLMVETSVYGWMERLCPSYSGGYWNFVELSNGGGYMAPRGAEFFDLRVEGNGFDGRVSADAAGVIATGFALNSLVWRGHHELGERYEQLLDFIDGHAEQAAIRQALD